MERACRIAVEAIANIKTVASLGQETSVLKRYGDELFRAEAECYSKVKYRGLAYGMVRVVPILGFALAFYYGTMKVANDGLEYKFVIMCVANLGADGRLYCSNIAISGSPNR